uniref:DAGKc domain-containing protein n=2 Tax=Lotharella globosa TaxID=91324 RepID=A0A7S4DHB1_9EUKA
MHNEQRQTPLLDGSSHESYRGSVQLAFGTPKSKPVKVSIDESQLSAGATTYELRDMIGATTNPGGLTVHYYPLTTGCCSKPQRRYSPLRFFTRDTKVATSWASIITRAARHLGIGEDPPPRRKILCYVNPFSGSGGARQIIQDAVKMFDRAHIDLNTVYTKREGQVEEEIVGVDLDKYESVLIVSGDGLVMEYLNGIMARKDWEQAISKPFGILPAGSGNGLSASIRQVSDEPMDPTSAAFLVAKGQTRPLDLVSFKQPQSKPRYGMLSLSWGLISDIDINSEICRCCGAARFTAYAILRLLCTRTYYGSIRYIPSSDGKGRRGRSAGIKSLRQLKNQAIISQPASADAKKDDGPDPELGAERAVGWVEVPNDTFTLLWAVNTPMADEENLLVPEAELDDGVINLMYLEGNSWCSTLCTLLRVEDGTQTKDPNFKLHKVDKLTLSPDVKRAKGLYSLDGEPTSDNDSRITMQVHPGVLTTYCG